MIHAFTFVVAGLATSAADLREASCRVQLQARVLPGAHLRLVSEQNGNEADCTVVSGAPKDGVAIEVSGDVREIIGGHDVTRVRVYRLHFTSLATTVNADAH